MDPNVQEAEDKLSQAEQIEETAGDLRANDNGDSAADLEASAASLRSEAEQERADAENAAEQEKAEVDEKYGTS